MADQQNYMQEQERRAAENRVKLEAAAREKVAARMREADQKRQEQRARDLREQDRKRAEAARAEAARARDRQQQEHRAKAREHAKAKAAEALKKEAAKAKEQPEQKQMAGANQGPTMRPSSGNKQRDQLEMAAEMDHPGLNDGQKAELQRQGVAMGEGFKNREEQRRKEAEARESRKTPADKAEDKVWFKQGKSYEERQALEIKRDKRRVREVEQGKNDVLMPRKEPKQEQVREPEKTQAKAPAKAFEFTKENEEPTRGGH